VLALQDFRLYYKQLKAREEQEKQILEDDTLASISEMFAEKPIVDDATIASLSNMFAEKCSIQN
jgi:hypothetical protein